MAGDFARLMVVQVAIMAIIILDAVVDIMVVEVAGEESGPGPVRKSAILSYIIDMSKVVPVHMLLVALVPCIDGTATNAVAMGPGLTGFAPATVALSGLTASIPVTVPRHVQAREYVT